MGYISAYTANLIITPTSVQRLSKFIRDHPHPNNTKIMGIIDIIPRMIALNGWKSLWGGSIKNTNKFSLWQGLGFSIQNSLNKYLINDQPYILTTFQRYFLSGMISGILCCSLYYPIDRINSTILKMNSLESRKMDGIIMTFR